ncbi:A disintegrin and metalloproteinase with thrombospondin motifs 1-like [Pseudomyrmex gracilis]|uniref:A disintegrin and metalloproteinase with thrombospondin motifs 1-like n=1 Tax=Pseudomyrmex gracilis TaxID=219809 RepID=UPI000995B8CE|nr:A disintegrin and metalloproteinase with thrombospondin motifs 1-like [Pseudomyrmex gracilis]
MLLTVFLLCLAGTPFVQCEQLHDHMTPKEVMAIFHTPHHLVPEYEVVPVQHRFTKQEDSDDEASELKLKAFNEDIKLYLNPTEGILATKNTPVWFAKSKPEAPEGLQYRQIPQALNSIGVMLQDVNSSSSLLLTPNSDGGVRLNGILKNSFVIKSIPGRVLKKIVQEKTNLLKSVANETNDDDDNFSYTDHHIVYKVPPSEYSDFKITNPENHRAKRDAPQIIYPEVLVVIDHGEFEKLGEDLDHALTYLLSFWNAVDLRYRLLTTPKIRFNIAGIIIAADKDATPYLQNSLFKDTSVDADLALRGMADYFYRETRFPTDFYDFAIAMTSLDLCNMLTDDYCDTSTLGYAYVAGACDRNATKQSSEAVGLVEDNGGYAGIIPTAHEVGHLIGARHDGNPKAGDCSAFDGFIMTNGLMLSDNGFEWSSCSINAFYKFINEDRAKCLYNEPISGIQVERVLPGKLMSLDEQCYQVLGTKACNANDSTVCTRLECEYPEFQDFCRATAPAAEGSPCGDGLYCLNGKCVVEGILTKEQKKKISIKEFIPKFTHQVIKKIPWLDKLLHRVKDRVKERVWDRMPERLRDRLRKRMEKILS